MLSLPDEMDADDEYMNTDGCPWLPQNCTISPKIQNTNTQQQPCNFQWHTKHLL